MSEAFLENPNNLPEVNHIDSNKTNNILTNLEWVNKSQNMLHYLNRPDASLGEKRPNAKLKNSDIPNIRLLLKNKISRIAIAKLYNVSPATINNIANGKSWKRF